MGWGCERLKFYNQVVLTSLMLALGVSSQAAGVSHQRPAAVDKVSINVEVCFTLDTTGSMSGLIDGAKKKIWSIANNIVNLDPRPNVSFCLLAYRDRQDAYITKLTDLTPDIDEIYRQLLTYTANGGGDMPESVNQALDETINKVSWSPRENTLRIVYLVGDAPPHMDYAQEKQYPAIAVEAIDRDIVINTIQCGNIQEATPIWQEIARLTGGQYSKLKQSGNVQIIKTPMDQDFVALNRKVNETLLPYGTNEAREMAYTRQKETERVNESTIADRLSYNARTQKIKQSGGDLIDDLNEGVVLLESIPENHLPKPLQGLTLSEKNAFIQTKQQEREEYQAIISALNTERQAYIDKHESSNERSFDKEVINGVKTLAKQKGFNLR